MVILAAQLLLLAGLFQFSDGIQVASNGALRGLKDTRVPMAITLFAYWVRRHAGGLVAGVPPRPGRARHVDGADRRPVSVAAVMLFVRFWRSAWRERWPVRRRLTIHT